MEGKIKGGSTTKVTITDEDSNVTELVYMVDIEKVITLGNDKLGDQIEGGRQLFSP